MARKPKSGATQLDLFADPTPVTLAPEDQPDPEAQAQQWQAYLESRFAEQARRGKLRAERIAAGLEAPWAPPTWWLAKKPASGEELGAGAQIQAQTPSSEMADLDPDPTRAAPTSFGAGFDTVAGKKLHWWEG